MIMLPQDQPDDFEKSLSRQPVKQIPGEWRAEILAAASAAAPVARHVASSERGSVFSALAREISALLWPHPKAWAGLAAVWLLIAAVNFSTREGTAAPAIRMVRPSSEVLVELRQQQKFYADLVGITDTRDADRPQILSPRPRSERAKILSA
jgi:hypothetical protein